MNWTELLRAEIDSTYVPTERMVALVEDSMLDWKPSTGTNWMTTGQLLKHLTESCGAPFKAFITGDWGLPEGTDPSVLTRLPTAEELPTVENVAEAKRLMQEDKRVALEILASAGEDKLAKCPAPAPWDPTAMLLGRRLLQMVDHMKQHKGQLFYYLKLQGKPVDTGTLWGV